MEYLLFWYVFYDFNYVKVIVVIVVEFIVEVGLLEVVCNVLIIVAWFYDVGYIEGEEGYE